VIVSVMAKKIASGATHVIFDVPVGPTMKIQHFKDAQIIADKFTYLAKKFHIKVVTDVNEMQESAGRGIGPVLEARDVFEVLEQQSKRPLALEAKALRLAGKLLDLCCKDCDKKKGISGEELAKELLVSGKALEKMKEIIKAQGGDPHRESSELKPGEYIHNMKSAKHGIVTGIDNRQISVICRILGCPTDKKAGMYLDSKLEDRIDKGDILCTIYSSDKWRLQETIETLKHVSIYTIS